MEIARANTIQINTSSPNLDRKMTENSTCFQNSKIFDEFIIITSDKKKEATINKGEKITSKEALKLMINGATSQIDELIKQTIKNPLKILVPTIATSTIILALPLIGISSAVGAGALAITTASISVTRLIKNIYELKKNNASGEYNKSRQNYKNIGNATFDLGLSLPFLPKAIKSINDFAKYGKIHVNMNAIQQLKNTKEIIPTLKKANQEINRGYEYTKIVDKQLSGYEIPKAQKAQIRKELLEFNVPEAEIPNVVLKKLAKHKGYTAYPKAEFEALRENVQGQYSGSKGRLRLKDPSKPAIPDKQKSSRQIIKRVIQYDETSYKCEMENPVTGEITYEYAPKKLLDEFIELSKRHNELSPQGRTISIVVHEFEHFDQHAKIARLRGINPKYEPKAQKLYKQAIDKQGIINPHSPLAKEVREYINVNMADNKNYAKYLQNAKEVGARKAQFVAISSPEFQRLDAIFKELPELNDVSITESLIPSIIHTTTNEI